MCGWQVKLCDTIVTHGPYLSAFEIGIIKLYINPSSLLYFYFWFLQGQISQGPVPRNLVVANVTSKSPTSYGLVTRKLATSRGSCDELVPVEFGLNSTLAVDIQMFTVSDCQV